MRNLIPVALCAALLGVALPARADEPAGPPAAVEKFWGERRAVGVVQKRRFEKQGRIEAALYTGWIPNDAFTTYVPVGARVTYFLSEAFGLELGFEYDLHVDTRLKDLLHAELPELRAQIRDRQQYRVAVDAVWIPLYGKFAFHNTKIGHFEGYLLGGAGTVRTGASEIGLADSFRPELNVGLGLRFYLGRMTSIRLEGRDYIYWAQKNPDGEGGGLTQAWQLGAAFAVLFGGGPK
ncbi:MAG TPA: outer membrane beta-barrel domain-containing protein [Polyangia bacterium]|jgi:outer membrane beta-barrel protein